MLHRTDSKDVGIDEMMRDLITAYFERLGLPAEEAAHLRHVRWGLSELVQRAGAITDPQ